MIKIIKSVQQDTRESRDSGNETRWINGPSVDFFMAFSWIPFTLFALFIEDITNYPQAFSTNLLTWVGIWM